MRQTNRRNELEVCCNNIQWTNPLWIIDDVREWQRDNLATSKVKFQVDFEVHEQCMCLQ
jgi:hypothetical protein